MPDTLIFLDKYPEKLSGKLASLNITTALFLTGNEKTVLKLQAMSYRVYFMEEILTSKDIEKTDRICLDFIHSVFSHSETNPFQYKEFPAGNIVEFYFIPYFMRLFRNTLCTSKIIDHFSYDRIIAVGTGSFIETIRLVLKQKGIPFESFLDGHFHRLSHLIEVFSDGKKNLWAGRPLRDLLVESVQNFLIIGESYFAKTYSSLKGRRVRADPSKKCLIFSADQYTCGVYKALNSNREWQFLTCGTYYRFRRTVLKDVASFEGNFQPRMVIKTTKVFIHFLRAWLYLSKNADFKKDFEFHGINYWDRIKNLIKYHMLISFPRLFLDYLIAVEAFERNPRSLLIVFDDHVPYYKTITHAAKLCRVKSVVIQHGEHAGINGTNEINADFYAAWGTRAIDWFGSNWDGRSADKIFITGSPRYDEYAVDRNFQKAEILNELNLPHNKKLILILTEWSQDFSVLSSDMRDLSMISAVLGAVSRLGLNEDCHIIIKPHPGGDIDLLEQFYEMKRDVSPHVTIIKNHLKELLFVTDICVSAYSSCILEAMFYEKPSVVFDNFSIKEYVPYVSRGAALGASNESEMADSIKTLLFDEERKRRIIENQKKYIEYSAYKVDGKSSERVCKFLDRIISGEELPRFI